EGGREELTSRSCRRLELGGRLIELTFREQIEAAPERTNDQIAAVECLARRRVIAPGSRLSQRGLEIRRVPLDHHEHCIQEIPFERDRSIELWDQRSHQRRRD